MIPDTSGEESEPPQAEPAASDQDEAEEPALSLPRRGSHRNVVSDTSDEAAHTLPTT